MDALRIILVPTYTADKDHANSTVKTLNNIFLLLLNVRNIKKVDIHLLQAACCESNEDPELSLQLRHTLTTLPLDDLKSLRCISALHLIHGFLLNPTMTNIESIDLRYTADPGKDPSYIQQLTDALISIKRPHLKEFLLSPTPDQAKILVQQPWNIQHLVLSRFPSLPNVSQNTRLSLKDLKLFLHYCSGPLQSFATDIGDIPLSDFLNILCDAPCAKTLTAICIDFSQEGNASTWKAGDFKKYFPKLSYLSFCLNMPDG